MMRHPSAYSMNNNATEFRTIWNVGNEPGFRLLGVDTQLEPQPIHFYQGPVETGRVLFRLLPLSP